MNKILLFLFIFLIGIFAKPLDDKTIKAISEIKVQQEEQNISQKSLIPNTPINKSGNFQSHLPKPIVFSKSIKNIIQNENAQNYLKNSLTNELTPKRFIESNNIIGIKTFNSQTSFNPPKLDFPKNNFKLLPFKQAAPKIDKKIKASQNLPKKSASAKNQQFDTKTPIPSTVKLAPKRHVYTQPTSNAPKIYLIIDDISFKRQIVKFRTLGLPLTYSILPPTNAHPNSGTLYKMVKSFMVHLPLEAKGFKKPEPHTLKINDTQTTIDARIRAIKKIFPTLRYINNHTGSTFTANTTAMRKLLQSLKQANLQFLDSKTIDNTATDALCKELKMRCAKRDIFMDNEPCVSYIKKQLQKAKRLARKKGMAVVIGHPRSTTFEALRQTNFDGFYLGQVHELFK